MVILLFPLKSSENLIKHDKDNFLISDDFWGNEGAFLTFVKSLEQASLHCKVVGKHSSLLFQDWD